MMTAKEALDAIFKLMKDDAEAAARDVMLYGKTLISITPDGLHRVPPEDCHLLASDIVLPKKANL